MIADVAEPDRTHAVVVAVETYDLNGKNLDGPAPTPADSSTG